MLRPGRHIAGLLGVLILCAPAATTAAPLPKQITLTYKVQLGRITLGRLVTAMHKIGDEYEVHAHTEAEGLAAILLRGAVRETCRFKANPHELRPTRYQRTKEGFGSSTHATQFDWHRGRIIFADGTPVAIPNGYVIDNCSAPFAYMRDGQDGFKKRTLHIVGYKSIRHYDLVDVRREKLKIPLGEFETIRVEHVRRGKDLKFIVWLAAQRNDLPIKIMEKRPSRTTTMVAEKVEGLP